MILNRENLNNVNNPLTTNAFIYVNYHLKYVNYLLMCLHY